MQWKEHPVYRLIACEDGTVKKHQSSKIAGFLGVDGYIHVNYGKLHLRAHRIVYECFHHVLLDPKQYIDHIDGVKHHNALNNLQLLTHSEHALKTRKDNPNMTTKAALTRRRAVLRISLNTLEEVTFVSQKAAADATPGAYSGHISNCVRGVIKTHCGYVWKYAEDTSQERDATEYWVSPFKKEWRGLEVSSKGRIKTRRSHTFIGTNVANYLKVRIRNKPYFVHRIVCTCFHGVAPQGMTSVDHIDRNTTNNHENNLRWSNDVLQAANRRPRTKM
jgi:hypothetical protein